MGNWPQHSSMARWTLIPYTLAVDQYLARGPRNEHDLAILAASALGYYFGNVFPDADIFGRIYTAFQEDRETAEEVIAKPTGWAAFLAFTQFEHRSKWTHAPGLATLTWLAGAILMSTVFFVIVRWSLNVLSVHWLPVWFWTDWLNEKAAPVISITVWQMWRWIWHLIRDYEEMHWFLMSTVVGNVAHLMADFATARGQM